MFARVIHPVVGWAVSWLTVLLIALATTAGFVSRWLTPDDAPYPLMSRDAGDHVLATLAIFVVVLAIYSWLNLRLVRLVASWRHGVSSAPATGRRTTWVMDKIEWAFARWWRISLVLFVVWLPFYATSWPGMPSPDGANMMTEFLLPRSYFDGVDPTTAGADQTAPYLDYPTSTYLMNDSDTLWSNHHPFFLMMTFGGIASASLHLFGSLVPGIVVISTLSALVTLVAFGRALWLLGTFVTSWKHRAIGLGVVLATPLIALWSMAIHKNQLFSAGFVWWLGLQAELVHTRGRLRRGWYVETFGVSVLVAVSVQFGVYLLVAQAVVLLLVKGRRFTGLVTMGVPALLITGSLAALTAAGTIIPSDPIETKALQLGTLGLILKEHPDALTPEERAELSKAFDLDDMVARFDPWTSDRAKSTGTLADKGDSYRYETATPEDFEEFNAIVARVALRYPATTVDSLFLKSYRYLDPFDDGTNWYPPWREGYEREIGGDRVSPIGINSAPREAVRRLGNGCYEQVWCRPTVSHSLKTVIVVMFLGAAIAVRRRFAWLWALPVALQLGIAGISPLSAGGRYMLGLTYALGIILLLLMIDDRSRDEGEDPSADAADEGVDDERFVGA